MRTLQTAAIGAQGINAAAPSMRRVPYPSFPVGVEADEVVDGGDGADEDEVDAHEHQQPRHRPRSVRHLAPSFPSPPPDEGQLVDEREH